MSTKNVSVTEYQYQSSSMPESASEKFDSFEKDEVMVQNYQMTKSMNQVIFDN